MKTWHVLFAGVVYAAVQLGPLAWGEFHKHDLVLQCLGGVEYTHLANGTLMVNLDVDGRAVPCDFKSSTIQAQVHARF